MSPSTSGSAQSRFWVRIILALVLSFAAGAALGLGLYGWRTTDPDCLQQLSRKSPILDDIVINLAVKQFNGSLFQENTFRQSAGPEADEAWDSLGVNCKPLYDHAVIVPENQALAAGFLESQVQVSKSYGGGFPAHVEGLHHLHCLDLLRRSLYFNVEYYKKLGKDAFGNVEWVLRGHINHCLDILRQQLMCTVDIGLLGQVWWDPKAPKAFPDFNTLHVCRDFESVRKWAEEHQAPQSPPKDYLQGPKKGDVFDSMP